MANIITSKTRSRMLSNPKDRAMFFAERRHKTAEKHEVFSVTPVGPEGELDIHQNLDKQGSGVKEAMQANKERSIEERKKNLIKLWLIF